MGGVFGDTVGVCARFCQNEPVTLFFDLSYNGFKIAEVTETFTPLEDGGYIIKSHAVAVGLAKLLHGDVVRESRGRLNDESGLQTNYYREKRGSYVLQKAVFDEATGEWRLFKDKRGKKETRVEKPASPIYDYLNAAYRGYTENRLFGGKITMTNGWRLKTYDYQIGETEKMTTVRGTLSVVPIIRESPRGKRIFWLAAEMDYLPIKSYVDDKGHVFETVLTGASMH